MSLTTHCSGSNKSTHQTAIAHTLPYKNMVSTIDSLFTTQETEARSKKERL